MERGTERARLAAAMAGEAAALVEQLDDTQRAAACWPFPADDERRRWYYTPTDHGGLTLSHMTSPQHRQLYRLLSTSLSTAGYVTMSTIIGLENVLDLYEQFGVHFGRDRGRDPLLYYVRLFGEPSASGTWAWRFGGHHVSLNYTIVDGEVAGTTPLFFGADPANVPLLGPHPLRPLEGVEDLARELMRSLDDVQRAAAVVSPHAPSDLVGANRTSLADGDLPIELPDIFRRRFDGEVGAFLQSAHDGLVARMGVTAAELAAMAYTRRPKGLAASALGSPQREMLDTLLRRYVDRLPDALADEEAAKFAGALLDDVHVLWAGGLEPGEPHYYRLHAPTLLAEYDNSARGANHVHAVWRDPRGDFGGDVLARHLAEHHGGH